MKIKTKEERRKAFFGKAKENQENFRLHQKLIEDNLCKFYDKTYVEDLKVFADRQVVDNMLLLQLIEYAEAYHAQSITQQQKESELPLCGICNKKVNDSDLSYDPEGIIIHKYCGQKEDLPVEVEDILQEKKERAFRQIHIESVVSLNEEIGFILIDDVRTLLSNLTAKHQREMQAIRTDKRKISAIHDKWNFIANNRLPEEEGKYYVMDKYGMQEYVLYGNSGASSENYSFFDGEEIKAKNIICWWNKET